MRSSSLPRLVIVHGILALSSAWFAEAQEKAPPSKTGVLESVPAKVAKFEQDLVQKIDAARTVIDKEVVEKRLAESVAQTLRWSLRTSAIAFSGADIRGILATARVPFENDAVTKACKDLETTWLSIQAEYTDLQKAAIADARKRAVELIKTADKPEQIDPFIDAAESAQTVLQRRFAGTVGSDPSTTLTVVMNAMRNLRRLVEAEATGNTRMINAAISTTQAYGMDPQGGVEAEMRQRLDRVRAPYLEKVDTAQAALDAAIEAKKPSEEVAKLFSAFSDAVDQVNAVRSNFDYGQARDFTSALGSYRSVMGILDAMEAKDFAGALQQIRSSRANPGPDGQRASKVVALLRSWETEVLAEQTKFYKGEAGSWRDRLNNAKGPADLDGLAAEISQVEQISRDERRGVGEAFPVGLSQAVTTLAAAWRSSNPMLLRQGQMQDGGAGRPNTFGTELSALRRRIERDIIGRVLKAPEVNKPPLAEMEPEAAFEALCDQLAEKKEWRRLLEVRQAWRITSAQDGSRGGVRDELASALHSYLAGQNFELAEQWMDAASAYKEVLLCTTARAPVSEAAERLKSLKKEHPETAQAAAAPSRSVRGQILE